MSWLWILSGFVVGAIVASYLIYRFVLKALPPINI